MQTGVLPAYMHCTMSVQCMKRPEDNVRSSWTRVIDRCEPPYEVGNQTWERETRSSERTASVLKQ